MKKNRLRTTAGFACLSMMLVTGAGYAKESPKIKIDSVNTGTYTGEAGKDNFMANCSPCHGETGKGDGPLAETLGEGIKARNLSDTKLLSARSDEFLFKAVKSGGVAVGLSEAMPSWKETFSDAEIKQIVQYVRNGICKCPHAAKK